jgi:tRNA(fMet)-specific endonuclease VapC
MSGNRYLLDTNAIVALLKGNTQLIQLLQNANWIGISVISQIEFLAFSGLTQSDRQLFQQFL